MTSRIALLAALAATFSVLLGVSGSASSQPPCWSNAKNNTCLPVATSQPRISGATVEGQPLVVDSGNWQGSPPLTFAYQWRRCDTNGASCTSISGATSQSYTLSSSDVAATIRATVTATNNLGSNSADSAATPTIAPRPVPEATPPSDTTLPTASGNTVVGQTLSASTGSWSGTTPMTYAYQWRRCDSSGSNCATISGATSQTYTLGSGDLGEKEVVSVTASNSAGSSSANSAPTSVVVAPSSSSSSATSPSDSSLPGISGLAQSGQTLTGSLGSWTGTSPLSYGYQWLRCDAAGASCVSISGATSQSYLVAPADAGFTLRVTVTAANSAGSASAQSPQTASVTAASTSVTWTNIADEHGSFSLPATTTVRYGKNSTWTQKDLAAGNYTCDNALFGDPLAGTFKECDVSSASPAALSWAGDYETGGFSQWWLQEWTGACGGCTTSTVGNSTATIVTSPVAQGQYAAKFQVFPTTGSSDRDRAEIVATQAASGGYPGQEWYYGWWTYFPGPSQQWWSAGGGWNDITQFFSTDNTASQTYLGIDATGAQPMIYVDGMPLGHRDLVPLQYDHWYHFMVHVKWSVDPSVGFIEIWIDGNHVVPLTIGETLKNQSSPASSAFTAPGMYLSQGIYRGASSFTNTVIHDGLCRADSYAAAATC